ncbi:MAG: hypothetical protein IPM63_18220 [Acidobacteriota bacterium]|nr:MAG: hypothetical protein IPM63_18220 [Acidobacteriota bacterium]
MPDACSLCLGKASDLWPVQKTGKKDEIYGEFQPLTEDRGTEITKLDLSVNEGGLSAPVCYRCKKRLTVNRRICAAFVLMIIIFGSIVCFAFESYSGLGVFWLVSLLLTRSKKSWANRPILGGFRLVPGEFREWDINDDEARMMGCRVLKGRLLVLTVNGIVEGNRIPVFTNPEFQRKFNVLNGIETAYGIPQRAVEDSIYGFTLNQVRK